MPNTQSDIKKKATNKVKSKVKRKVKSKIRKSPVIIAILLVLIAVSAFLLFNFGEEWFGISPNDLFGGKNTVEKAPAPADGEVLFHFIDVGQGDAILITSKSGNMLIDTSESGERDKLVAYLESADIKDFKYVVFTHTDADHIGSADYIINNYEVDNVLLPDVVGTTDTYERMMDAIDQNQVNLILIGEGEDCQQSGYSFRLGSLVNTVIAPNEDYGKDYNNASIVIKATYGDTSVMLTGDAEDKSEADILAAWNKDDLKCDILKVGHHGSSSSTTQEFLDAVNPSIAVISCGKDNGYGHPHDEVIKRLEAKGVKVYRTDKQGNIVFKTDGKNFTYVEK